MERKIDNPITHFSIKGLFEQFDYELDFTVSEGYNIIFLTGPNGYGKTAILHIMLYMLVGRKYWPIDKGHTNFKTATITFQNGDTITATPEPNSVHYFNSNGGEYCNKLPLYAKLISPINDGTALFHRDFDSDDPLFDKLEKDFHINPNVRECPICASHGEANLIQLFDVLTDDGQPLSYLFIDSIDEGMHVAWQHDLGDKIKKLRPETQVIYATHSPSVISSRWDSCVDLYDVLEDKTVD